MNTATGAIGSYQDLMADEIKRQRKKGVSMSEARRVAEGFIKPVNPKNLPFHVRVLLEAQGRAKISRNSPCPCGSGKRFKRCCMTSRA